jgi:hypothetical protein
MSTQRRRSPPFFAHPSSIRAAEQTGRLSDRILTAGDVEAIADAIARKLVAILGAGSSTFRLVDARELAQELGVSTDYVYVYVYAGELGEMRLGPGPKARVRFDR